MPEAEKSLPDVENSSTGMLADLRKRWQEAVADDSEGLEPDPVFDRLEAKYSAQSKKNPQK